jgi:hypothetical protein
MVCHRLCYTEGRLDRRTLQSIVESGQHADYDRHQRKRGSKVHLAVDTLGQLPALHFTPANEQDREQVGQLTRAIQEVTGTRVELAFVDQGYTSRDRRRRRKATGST